MKTKCRRPAPAARECTLFPDRKGMRCRWMYNYRDSLFVPSFRALDCSNFIGISGWLYRQFFTTDYITVLKVHWLTITWYSSYASCFKISILTKLSEYFEEAIDTRIWHSQTLFVDWCLSSKRYGREIV